MARKFTKKVLGFAKEAIYGSDAIDSGTASYVLAREVKITPMAGESTALEYDNGELGNSPELVTELYVTLEFGCDFCAAKVAEEAAPWGDLTTACLRSVAGTDPVSYPLNDDGTDSLTFYFHMDGTLHALVGARGSMSMSAAAKAFPELRFTFTGLFVKPKTQTHPTPNFDQWRTPLKVGAEHTSATLDGNAIKMISLEYDQANQVSHQEYVGHEEVMITDYQPTGTLIIEADSLAQFDPFGKTESGEAVAFSLTHGPAGNQVGWSTDKLQLGRPTYADQNGTLTYSIPVRPLGNVDKFTSS